MNVFGQSPHVFDPRIDTEQRDPEYWDRVHKTRATMDAERKREDEKNRAARDEMIATFREVKAEREAAQQAADEQRAIASRIAAAGGLEAVVVDLLDRVAALEQRLTER